MIEYCIVTRPYAVVSITAFENESVEKAFHRNFLNKIKIDKVIAKRDREGDGVWIPINQ